MTPLQSLLEKYREWLSLPAQNVEVAIDGDLYSPSTHLSPLPPVQQGDILYVPPSAETGRGIELLVHHRHPSLPIWFLVPLSQWYEFATPSDVLVLVEGMVYIAQTDLGMDVPEKVPVLFGKPEVVGRLSEKDWWRVTKVLNGIERGNGPLTLSVHQEFKNLEARRYAGIALRALKGGESCG